MFQVLSFNKFCESSLQTPIETSMVFRFSSKSQTCIKNLIQSSSSNSSDPLQYLIVKFKEQSGQVDQFIQSIRLVPDPNVVKTMSILESKILRSL